MNFKKTMVVAALTLASTSVFAATNNLDHVVVYDSNFEQTEYTKGTNLPSVDAVLFDLVGKDTTLVGFTEENFGGDRHVFDQKNIQDMHIDHDKIKSLKVLGDVPKTVGSASALYMMNNKDACLDVAYFVSNKNIPKTPIGTVCQSDEPQELLDFKNLGLNLSAEDKVNITVSNNEQYSGDNNLVAGFHVSLDKMGNVSVKSILGTTGFDANVAGFNLMEVGKKKLSSAASANFTDTSLEKLSLKISSAQCVDVSYFINSKNIDKTLIGEFCPGEEAQFAFDFANPALALTHTDSVNFVVDSKTHNAFVGGFSATRNAQAGSEISVDYNPQFSASGYKTNLIETNVMEIGKSPRG